MSLTKIVLELGGVFKLKLIKPFFFQFVIVNKRFIYHYCMCLILRLHLMGFEYFQLRQRRQKQLYLIIKYCVIYGTFHIKYSFIFHLMMRTDYFWRCFDCGVKPLSQLTGG